MALIHRDSQISVPNRAFGSYCDPFVITLVLANRRYSVQSPLSLSVVQLFDRAIEGELIDLANENFSALSQLCDDFGF
jgi:hypothetical protein